MKKLALYILPITFGVFMAAFFTHGQIPSPPPTPVFTTIDHVFRVVEFIVRLVYWFFFLIAILFVILAAFTYLTAGGDPGKVKKASEKLIYAVVAVAVALIAWGIESIVRNVLERSR